MDKPFKLPFYLRYSQVVLGIVAFFYILYVGKNIIVPFAFSTIFAILLNPLVNYLNRQLNRFLAIAIAILFAMVVVGCLIYFITFQLSMFSDSLPLVKQKFSEFYEQAIVWISDTFSISREKISQWINDTKIKQMNSGDRVIGQTIMGISSALIILILTPVYIFMILYYKPLLLEFIKRAFAKNKHMVGEVLHETKSLIQSYLLGLLIEAAIVATLNSVGLLVIGIQYAILLGIISALLNIIPYIGGVISIGIAMIVAISTKSMTAGFLVAALYVFVQIVDNNFLVPKIVASKVKVNALASIIVVLIGSALWGVSGMFLSIPLTAIIKVICDRIDPLKPLGYLLGDTMPQNGKIIFNFPKILRK